MSEAFARALERRMIDIGLFAFDEPVIFGSAVMKLHGFKRQIGDVDLFVSPLAYGLLRDSGPPGYERKNPWREERPNAGDPPLLGVECRGVVFHAFHAWTARDEWLDVPRAVAAAVRVHGLLCVPLAEVARWKCEALRATRELGIEIAGSAWEKHEHDLEVLRAASVVGALL